MGHNYQRRERKHVDYPAPTAHEKRIHEIDRIVTGYRDAYLELHGKEPLLIHERNGWYTVTGRKYRLPELQSMTIVLSAQLHERNITANIPESDQ